MKRRWLFAIAGAGLLATAGGAVVTAELLGIDTLLMVESLFRADPESEEARQAAEDAVAADPHAREALGKLATLREVGAARPDKHAAPDEKHGAASPAEEPDGHAAATGARKPAGHATPEEKAGGEDDGHGTESHAAKPGDGKAETEHGDEHAAAASREFDPAAHMLPPGKNQPWRLFRQLQLAQDRIVMGYPGALAAYREEMRRVADEMIAMPGAVWQSERNVLSAAAYVMGGGKPDVARVVLDQAGKDVKARDLLAGALAYARGKYYEAYNLLYHFEPEDMPASMAGQLALIRAMLISPRDLGQAIDYLTTARQLAPGTLVEEAALRREVRVLSETGETEKFFREAGVYVRRFPNSVFLSDFLRNFAYGALKLAEKNEERVLAEVEQLEPRLSAEARLYLFSVLARGATVFGKFELARVAVTKSQELAGGDPRLVGRLNLYQAAASLTGSDTLPDATRLLQDFDRKLLGAEDARLLRAAELVAEQIRKPLGEPDYPVPPHVGDEPAETGHEDDDKSAPIPAAQEGGEDFLPSVISRSEAMLREADQVLSW